MHLAPGHPRLQLDDQLCSRVIRFATACPGHSGKKRGGAFNQPPPGGELASVVGEDVGETWQTQTYSEGLLGTSGVPHQKELISRTALSTSPGRQGTLSLSGPCSVVPSSRRPTDAVAARWTPPGLPFITDSVTVRWSAVLRSGEEREINRRIVAMSTVLCASPLWWRRFYQFIFVPTLTYGHNLLV